MNTTQRLILSLATGSLLAGSSGTAQTTYTWANSNVAGTPPANLDWFTGGPNTQGTWTGGDPISSDLNTIQFFLNATTQLPNTAAPSTQAVNLNNGGTAFQLGTLTLTGRASATSNANLTMNLSGDALNFSAATGTVNLNAINATRTITYNVANNIQLGTASSASNLTLTGNGDNGTGFNFSGSVSELQIGGGSKLIKSGSSTAILSGAVTVSGGVEVHSGTLILSGSSNAITGGFTLNGGVLRYTNATTVNGSNIMVNGTASFLQHTGSSTTDATITLNTGSNLSLGADANSQTITSAVTGAGSLTVNRAGGASSTINLNNTANTFTGNITFTNIGSTLTLNVNSLVDSVGAGNIRYTGTNFAGGIASYIFNLGSGAVAPLTLNNRQIEFTSTSTVGGVIGNNGSQAFTINTDLLVSSTTNPILYLGGTGSGLSSFNGLIANGTAASVSITKRESGTWVLGNSASSYTGPTSIQGGTLSIGKLADFGANSSIGAASSGAIVLGNGNNTGTLLYTGGAQETNRTIQINTSANTNTGGGAIINNGTGAITFTAATFNQAFTNGSTVTRNLALGGTQGGTISGTIQNNSATNSISLTKTGGGTWTLTGVNTYTGVTTVGANGGILQFGKVSSLYNGNTTSWTAANLRVANGGTLAFNVGGTGEFASADVGTLFTNLANSSNATTNGMAAGSRFGFDTTNASGGSFEISHVIANSGGSAGGARGLTKLGTGTLVLSNTNTYTGPTTVSAGTLLVNGVNTGGGLITVSAGATLGGTGAMGDVTVDDLGVLAPGASPGQMTVGNLTLNDTSVLRFELGAPTMVPDPGFSDHLVVNGDLTLDGRLQITALAGFPGAPLPTDKWLLISYSGTMADYTLELDSPPPGGYYIDTDTVGSVFLAVVVPRGRHRRAIRAGRCRPASASPPQVNKCQRFASIRWGGAAPHPPHGLSIEVIYDLISNRRLERFHKMQISCWWLPG
jgi:fibronectin-binding autotransporter adhesin